MFEISGIVDRVLEVPDAIARSSVEQNRIVGPAESAKPLRCIVMRTGALPDNFIPEQLGAEDAVQQKLQIVARRRIAVQVKRFFSAAKRP